GFGICRRGVSERACSQMSPSPGLEKQRPDLSRIQLGWRLCRVAFELLHFGRARALTLGEFDHHRLERAPFAAMNCSDRSRARRRVENSGKLPVLEEDLATCDGLALLDEEARFHSGEIISHESDMRDG